MNLFKHFLYVFFLTALISSCSKSEQIEVTHTNFEDEIEQQQNLVFTFDRDLRPDSVLNQWDSTEYFRFNPRVAGKFKWTQKNELTFSPAQPFSASTDFTATVQEQVLPRREPKLTLPEKVIYKFHTPYLTLLAAPAFWSLSPENDGKTVVRINLQFNYPVNPYDLQQLLTIQANGKQVPVQFTSSKTDSEIGIYIPDISTSDEPVPLQLTVAKGLKLPESKYETPTTLTVQAEVPSKDRLQIIEVNGQFTEGEAELVVLTNQPVVKEGLSGKIKVEPRVDYKVEQLENGFALKGAFESGKTYQIQINKSLRGVFGKELAQDFAQFVAFGELLPSIQFASTNSMYLGAAGERNLGVQLTKIGKVKVTISKIYANNILHFLRSGQEWGYGYDDDEMYSETGEYIDKSYHYYNDEDFGSVVSERVYTVKSLPKNGNLHLLHLNLQDLKYDDNFKGLYVVKVEDTDRNWLQVSQLISVSDIGLIAKQGEDQVMVFANSIRSAQPLEGLTVRFVSSTNQTIHTAKTDAAGMALFSGLKSQKRFKIGMITAQLGEDFNFMVLPRNLVETSRFEVGGKSSNASGYQAFLYGDRDIYRPGDTIHTNTIVRSESWQTAAKIPVKLKLLLPTGKEYKAIRRTLNDYGAATADFFLPAAVMTGLYTLEVYSGNDVLLGSRKISVEEFIPDRIKVDLKLNKSEARPGDSLQASVTATNLFGPPAANRKYELELMLKRKNFEAKKYPGYLFNLEVSEQVAFEDILKQGKTNNQGQASETFILPDFKDLGMLDGRVYTTVFDETGRTVNRLATFTIPTQQVFFGIKDFERWISTRQAVSVPLIALSKNEKPVTATAQVQVIRYLWETVVERRGSRLRYNSQQREQVLVTKNIAIPAGGSTFTYQPQFSGDYELRIMRPGALTYVRKRFYAYGSGDTQNNSFEVSKEGEVAISFDKEKYQVGEEAEILLKAPFSSKMLVTLERDRILDHFYVDGVKKSASLKIPVKETYLPNVYVTVTAIREITDNVLPLTVARGFAPLHVEKAETKIPVQIIAETTSRSKTKQHITVKSVPNAQLTIAVVDEGILQLKDFKTPQPYDYFYQKRALEVKSYDLYPALFPELSYRSSSTGGDGYDLSKRVNPLTSKRVRLVALWSGHLQTNSNGEADFNFDVPQFSGSLRVMAVVYKNASFGSGEQLIKVTDPVVISAALPRFLSPGDKIFVPVTLSNTTDKAGSATASIKSSGTLLIDGEKTQRVQLLPNSEKQVVFAVQAQSKIGQGSITVLVDALNEKFTDKTEITVRPAASLQKVTENGVINGGESLNLVTKNDFLPASISSELVLSKSPVVQFSEDIRYLIQYPVWLLEQTVSAVFPQLYFMDLAKAVGQEKKPLRYNPNYLVQEAIRKIEAMQVYNGAIAYWPGGDSENWWSSAYAAHFLTEAGKAGFAVNDKILDKLLQYLRYKIRQKEKEEYYFLNAQGQSRHKTIARKEIFYSLYVLAMHGIYEQSAMNYYKSNPDLLALDSRYLLAGTYYLAGNATAYRSLLPVNFEGENSVRALEGSFYSAIRDEAVALNTLIEVDPNNPDIGIMAKHLSSALKDKRWLNTQERAFSLVALGKLARKAATETVSAQVFVDDKKIAGFTGDDLRIPQGLSNKKIRIETSGSGNLYYFLETEGISASGKIKEEDQYLRVRRTYYDRQGREIRQNTFKQNDLIVVKLSIQSTDYSRDVPNVAITDLLPAGFEIENPRIGAVRELSWIKDMAQPDYFDIRDDRISYFTTATAKTKHFYYLVRAVTQGSFKQGPVSADAMYNAEYHSYYGAGDIKIE